jgi:histidinol-phosphate aminotransferase
MGGSVTKLSPDATLRQGGDLRGLSADRAYLDLGTCVNRYGPPPGVADSLRELDITRLRPHPYDAEQMFTSAYAQYLGVLAEELVAGRGITEFICLLGRLLPTDRVAVVVPDYTDSIRSFRNHLAAPDGASDTPETRLARIAEGMAKYDYVVVSNPNNPLGIYIPLADLTAVCRAHPRSTLIVDEAYVDFTTDGVQQSMIFAGVPNVVVLLSPNKLFGIAGTRTGALWSASPALRERVAAERLNWPLSYLDAVVSSSALRSPDWVAMTRNRLLTTAVEMESLLRKRFSGVVTDVPVHYRFVATDDAVDVHAGLAEAGIAVRVFSNKQRGRVSGLRITAPRDDEFHQLAAALSG